MAPAALLTGKRNSQRLPRVRAQWKAAQRKARFTPEQMVAIIGEADREPVSAVAKRHDISEQTIYTWRKRGALSSIRGSVAEMPHWLFPRHVLVEARAPCCSSNVPAK